MRTVYLDYNATTPVDDRVFEAMVPYLRDKFGNPSSAHPYGFAARDGVEKARRQAAGLLGCGTDEVVFTGGGSESNNYAIKGAVLANKDKGKHIITSQIEHPAVINPCRYLEKQGYRVTYLPVDGFGMVDPAQVEAVITDETILITIMHANNEVGTIQPISAIGRIARQRGIIFHTDAAQSVGKVQTNVDELMVDLLTVAGHKVYAPKGVGALYVRNGTSLETLIHGAGHEGGRRAGTENTAYIAGLGEACAMVMESMRENIIHITSLRDKLFRILQQSVEGVIVNGHPTQRLPNTLNLGFKGVIGSEILAGVPEIAASTGSACHEGIAELSGVLKAMKVDPDYGLGSVRLSLGKYSTEQEVELAARLIAERVKQLRKENRHS